MAPETPNGSTPAASPNTNGCAMYPPSYAATARTDRSSPSRREGTSTPTPLSSILPMRVPERCFIPLPPSCKDPSEIAEQDLQFDGGPSPSPPEP